MGVIIGVITFFITLLSGCMRNTPPLHKDSAHEGCVTPSDFSESITEQEARLVDIPLPLLVKKLDRFQQIPTVDEQYMIGYRSTLSIETLRSFYQKEMEYAGWQHTCCITGSSEIMLLFHKPDRTAVISLRNTDNVPSPSTHIIIGYSVLESSWNVR